MAVWNCSGPGRGWDPSGWICIDVRTPQNLIVSLFGPFGGQFGPIFPYYIVIWGFPLGPYWLLLAPIGSLLAPLSLWDFLPQCSFELSLVGCRLDSLFLAPLPAPGPALAAAVRATPRSPLAPHSPGGPASSPALLGDGPCVFYGYPLIIVT